MQFRLRTLLILATVGPPVLAWACFYPIQAAIVALFFVVAALPRRNHLLYQ